MSAITRRRFLAGSAAAGMGIFCIVSETAAKEVLLGHGTHRYRVVQGWGKTDPATHSTNKRPGSCIDHRDPANPMRVVASEEASELRRYSLEGRHIDTIPTPGGRCCNVFSHGENLYVSHRNGFISILDRNNQIVSNPGGSAPSYFADGMLKRMARTGDAFVHPERILVGDNGDIYVPQWNAANANPVTLVRVRA